MRRQCGGGVTGNRSCSQQAPVSKNLDSDSILLARFMPMTYPFLIGCSLPVQAADRLSSMPDRHARSRGQRDPDQRVRQFLAKQHELFGNRFLMTELDYRLTHQYVYSPRWARHT